MMEKRKMTKTSDALTSEDGEKMLKTLCLCIWGAGYELPEMETGSPYLFDRVVARLRKELGLPADIQTGERSV